MDNIPEISQRRIILVYLHGSDGKIEKSYCTCHAFLRLTTSSTIYVNIILRFVYLLNSIQFVGLLKCEREQQRLHLSRGRSAEKEEEEGGGEVEVEVYNQGMFKTELCDKWQQKGTCPYGDLCQFAHGLTELRPIIRHPRYKTQVCRMVLAGATCPYGHRCHFRHSLCPP